MKKVILVLATLAATVSFAKEVKVSMRTKSSALGQIADKNLAGSDATKLISLLLNGQSYEDRVSITESSCTVGKSLGSVNCSVSIGTDNLMDDDNGWGTIQKIDYQMDAAGKVIKAQLVMVAG